MCIRHCSWTLWVRWCLSSPFFFSSLLLASFFFSFYLFRILDVVAARKRVAIQTRLFTEHTMRCLSISLPSVLLGMATPTHGCDPSDRWLQAGSVRCRCARALCARVWYCIHRTRFGYIPGLLSSRPLPPSRSASSAHTFSFLFCFSMLTCTRSCWGVVARPNVLDARFLGPFGVC